MNKKPGGYWKQYQTYLDNSILSGQDQENKNIIYWKNKVFSSIVIYLLPVSILALVPGMIMSFTHEKPLLGIYDLLSFTALLLIAVVPGLSIAARKFIFIVCLYCLTIVLIYYLGTLGPALMYLLVCTFISVLIFSSLAVYATILINITLCILVAWMIDALPAGSPLIAGYTVGAWIADASNLVVLNLVCAICLNIIMNGFEKTLLDSKETEEKRRLIMNAALDAIICIDTSGAITFWNPQAEKVFGWKQPEVIGRKMSEVIVPEPFRLMHDHGLQHYLKTGSSPTLNVLLELNAINREGAEFPIELTILPIQQGTEEFFCAFIRDISKRKSDEKALRLSNERYNMVSMATNDCIWDWDLVTNVVIRDNKRLETALGYAGIEPADVDAFWNTHAHQQDWAAVTKKRNALLANPNENYWEDEYRFLKPDGSYATVFDRAYIIRDELGRAVRMIGASQDISERKKAEAFLRNNEMRFRSLIEKGSEIIALHDRNGILLYMSPSVTNLLGYRPEDRVGHSGFDAVYPDDKPRINQIMATLLKTPGAVAQAQWRHQHADGSWRWMDGVATNLLDDPAVNAVVHNFRDITAQKEAEEKVRAERNLLRTLIDNMPDAIYIKDQLGRKVLSNKVDLKINGVVSEAEILGKTAKEIFPGEAGELSYQCDQDIIETGKPVINREIAFSDANGKPIWLLNTKVPLKK